MFAASSWSVSAEGLLLQLVSVTISISVISAEIAEQGKEYTSVYVCPMHCESSGSDEEGTCPACGMTYVKNTDHTTNGHIHE